MPKTVLLQYLVGWAILAAIAAKTLANWHRSRRWQQANFGLALRAAIWLVAAAALTAAPHMKAWPLAAMLWVMFVSLGACLAAWAGYNDRQTKPEPRRLPSSWS